MPSSMRVCAWPYWPYAGYIPALTVYPIWGYTWSSLVSNGFIDMCIALVCGFFCVCVITSVYVVIAHPYSGYSEKMADAYMKEGVCLRNGGTKHHCLFSGGWGKQAWQVEK